MVYLQRVTPELVNTYIETGIQSYKQHYLHLWENENPAPYLSISFTLDVLKEELADENVEHYLVQVENTVIGIVKLIRDKGLDDYDAEAALLIQKIYLLREFSGKGYGEQLLVAIETYAKTLGKTLIWLDTMQKGKAIHFYLKNGFSIYKKSKLNLPHAIEEERPMWILIKTL